MSYCIAAVNIEGKAVSRWGNKTGLYDEAGCWGGEKTLRYHGLDADEMVDSIRRSKLSLPEGAVRIERRPVGETLVFGPSAPVC